MAKIVAAYTVPHTPSFIAEVAQNGAASPTAGFFATIKAHLDEINPDLLILIQNDHFNTFFLDNWPTFALGVAERTCGPSDQTPEMPQYEVPVAQHLARHLLSSWLRTISISPLHRSSTSITPFWFHSTS